jgi:site-specific recombinase XerD
MTRKTVYNANLVTEEKWKQVNEENRSLLEEFLEYKRSTGKSEETIYQYSSMLKVFFVWLLENAKNKFFVDITKRDLIKFQGYCLNTLGHSPNRVRTMRSAISSISNFIESVLDEEYEDFRNIVNKIEAPVKVPVREKTVLTFKECEEVADKLLEEGKVQLACFMMVACYSGLRKQELTRLLVKDFTTNIKMSLGNSFYKTTPIKVKGHGNRVEPKYVWNKVDKYLKAWLKCREESNIECEYLFCRKADKGYEKLLVPTANSFAESLNKYFPSKLYMHSLRHLLVSELERAGLPMTVSQFLLGHSNLSVTELYNDVPKDESMEQFADFFSGKVNKIENKKSLSDL